MPLETWYSTGTVSVAAGSTTVTGTSLFWGEDAIMPGDLFCDPLQPLVPPQRVKEVTGNAELELWAPWPGDGIVDALYEIRYVGIIERSTAQTRKVLEQLGEISAYFDVQVNTLADRAAFDARPSGYRVLVSDVGDGRAEIFSKMSSVAGDWSDGAPLGEIGPEGPRGPSGITWRGSWDGVTVYAAQDGVLYNGSSWRAKQANTNQAPPALPVIENAYWHLVSQAGVNGTGTGDVLGLGSSVSGRIAIWTGTSGKQLGQAGLLVSDLEPARTLVTVAEAQAGISTSTRGWSPQRVAQAILALSPPTDTSQLYSNVSILALMLADLQGFRLGMKGGVADPFDDESGINASGSANQSYDSALDLYRPTSTGGVLLSTAGKVRIGDLTSAGGLNAAFDGVTSQIQTSSALKGLSSNGFANTVGIDWGAGETRTIGRFRFFAPSDTGMLGGAGGALFKLQGSNDNSVWVDLYTSPSPLGVAGSTVDVTSGITPGAYRYHRLNINGNAANGAAIAELQFYEPLVAANMVLQSVAYPTEVAPSEARVVILLDTSVEVVPGTDFDAAVSRDGGVTWMVIGLSLASTIGSVKTYVSTAVQSFAGAPGSSMVFRGRTLTNKNIQISGYVMDWK